MASSSRPFFSHHPATGAGDTVGVGVVGMVVTAVGAGAAAAGAGVFFDILARSLANPTVILLSGVTDFTTIGLPVPSYTTVGGAGVGVACAVVGVCARAVNTDAIITMAQRMKRT